MAFLKQFLFATTIGCLLFTSFSYSQNFENIVTDTLNYHGAKLELSLATDHGEYVEGDTVWIRYSVEIVNDYSISFETTSTQLVYHWLYDEYGVDYWPPGMGLQVMGRLSLSPGVPFADTTFWCSQGDNVELTLRAALDVQEIFYESALRLNFFVKSSDVVNDLYFNVYPFGDALHFIADFNMNIGPEFGWDKIETRMEYDSVIVDYYYSFPENPVYANWFKSDSFWYMGTNSFADTIHSRVRVFKDDYPYDGNYVLDFSTDPPPLPIGGFSSVENINSFPSTHELSQNYPNPFNPSTRIAFSIGKKSHVTLIVYNIVGKEISTLVDNTMKSGEHSIVFDAQGIAPGLYFYTFTTGDFTETKKMILVK
jgi:hypothetical protein